jgi:hypothetical protein
MNQVVLPFGTPSDLKEIEGSVSCQVHQTNLAPTISVKASKENAQLWMVQAHRRTVWSIEYHTENAGRGALSRQRQVQL